MKDSNGRWYKEVTIRVDHSTTDWGQVTLYNDDPKYWCTIMEVFGEEIHQGYPGYTESERVVIEKFLRGVLEGCNILLGVVDPVNIPGPHPNRRR